MEFKSLGEILLGSRIPAIVMAYIIMARYRVVPYVVMARCVVIAYVASRSILIQTKPFIIVEKATKSKSQQSAKFVSSESFCFGSSGFVVVVGRRRLFLPRCRFER